MFFSFCMITLKDRIARRLGTSDLDEASRLYLKTTFVQEQVASAVNSSDIQNNNIK